MSKLWAWTFWQVQSCSFDHCVDNNMLFKSHIKVLQYMLIVRKLLHGEFQNYNNMFYQCVKVSTRSVLQKQSSVINFQIVSCTKIQIPLYWFDTNSLLNGIYKKMKKNSKQKWAIMMCKYVSIEKMCLTWLVDRIPVS